MIAELDDAAEICVTTQCPIWEALVPNVENVAKHAAIAGLKAAYPAATEIDLSTLGLAVVLADDATVRDLNRTWRHRDSATNVLSFPATDTKAGQPAKPSFPGQPLELGDVILAAETCRREAVEQGKSLEHHMRHLIVHGVLHLMGYDHLTDDEAERMERLEASILADEFGIADPYGDARSR